MATTATTALPDQQRQQQQQQQQPVLYPQAQASSASSNGGGRGAWEGSGSVGPFFAVIAVITVLTVLSCLLSRICAGRGTTSPPLNIRYEDCFWWLRRKCSRCISPHDVEIGSKVGKSSIGADETSSPPLT